MLHKKVCIQGIIIDHSNMPYVMFGPRVFALNVHKITKVYYYYLLYNPNVDIKILKHL
jgi:hypothetical protein